MGGTPDLPHYNGVDNVPGERPATTETEAEQVGLTEREIGLRRTALELVRSADPLIDQLEDIKTALEEWAVDQPHPKLIDATDLDLVNEATSRFGENLRTIVDTLNAILGRSLMLRLLGED